MTTVVQVIGKGSNDLNQRCKMTLLKVTGLTDKEIVSPNAIPIVKQALETVQLRPNTILDTGLKTGFSIVKERNGEFIGTAFKRDRSGRLVVRPIRRPIPESHSRLIRSKKDLVKAITTCMTVYSRIQFGKLKGWHKIPKQTAFSIAGQIKPTDSPKDWKFDECFGEIKDNCLYLGT